MVSKTPPTQNNKTLPVFNPVLIRETLNKVDRCMNRLQELQLTVSGRSKLVSVMNLSPRSTRNYLRTSLRILNSAQKTSPMGKFSKSDNLGGEWRQMSLPAMLVSETVVEILQASQFTREIVSSVGTKFATDDPKTPLSQPSNQKSDPENTQLRAKRRKEKENKQQYDSPPLQPHRSRSRINFKVSPPKKVRDFYEEKENNNHLANRVSSRNKPWSKKTVLFPNPLFSSTSSHQQESCKTKSSVVSRNTGTTTPHKFRIKSPHKFLSKSPNRVTTKTPPKFRIKSPHMFMIESLNRVTKTPHEFLTESQTKFRIKSPHMFRNESPKRVTETPHKYQTESQHKFLIKSPTTTHKFRTESQHKFLIKSPNRAATTHKFRIESPHKFQLKTPPSPKRATRLNFPKRYGAASISSRTISPTRLAAPTTKSKKSVQKSYGSVCLSKSSPKSKKSDGLSKSSPKRSAASKLRRSFSPSRLVTRLVLPLKSNKNVQKTDGLASGLKQRPPTAVHLPGPRF